MFCCLFCVDVPSDNVEAAGQRVHDGEAEVVSDVTTQQAQEAGKGQHPLNWTEQNPSISLFW